MSPAADCFEYIRVSLGLTKPQMYKALKWSRQRYHKARASAIDLALENAPKLASGLEDVNEADIVRLIQEFVGKRR